ncbi:MAG: Fe-S cluster assembly protein SufD [Acidimicrobiaceae bacterium]|nr:Fe-S cluster assembly protein SufD [Acidimicrobiaceae bacterium]
MHSFTADAARSLPGPGWLAERRAAAAERFAAADPPTAAAEEWRYSAIADFDLAAYRPANGSGAGASATGPMLTTLDAPSGPSGVVGVSGLVEAAGDAPAAAVVDVVDGRVVAIEGDDRLRDSGVFVGPLADAAGGEEMLGSVSAGASDYFTVLNDAFTPDPLVVDVPAGVVLDGPIVVRHLAGQAGAASFPRLVVRVGRDAQAAVLDVQHSAGSALVVPVVELDVGQAARLGYVNLQQHDHRTWQIAAHTARVERDAALVAASVALGGGYARTRTDTRLVGRGASGDLLSAYFGSGDQILDFRTYQDHAAPDTTSNLLYKGAVGDSARSVYTGLIRVRPNARGTNAFQTNRNLKLSEDAWAESVPNLEIENNDVRCSHASAVGPVDPDQVFYLESRGVPTPVAERLIVSGFFDEVIDGLPVPSVEDAAREALALKLNQMLKAAA